MRRRQIAVAVRSVLLIALGGATLSTPMGSTPLAGALPECVSSTPMFAWAGLRLNVLQSVVNCPEGSYAPGEHFAIASQATLALSLSTLLVGIAGILVAIGTTLWARKLITSVHTWLRYRLLPVPDMAVLDSDTPSPIAWPPVAVRPVRLISHPPLRRGPPTTSR